MAGKVPVPEAPSLRNISAAIIWITLDRDRFPAPPTRPASYFEKLAVARLDLLALRQHRDRIRLEQLVCGQRRMAGLFLDLRMERAMCEIIDQQLLSLRAKEDPQ